MTTATQGHTATYEDCDDSHRATDDGAQPKMHDAIRLSFDAACAVNASERLGHAHAGPYDLILADPPWAYIAAWPRRGNAAAHYATMDYAALCALPVADIAAQRSVLILWATALMLPQALQLMGAWGFQYRGVFCTWVKTTANGSSCVGCGFYTRNGSEFALLGVRGRRITQLRRGGRKDVRQVLHAPRAQHSRKPVEVHRMAEAVFPGAKRRIELFARARVDGWDAWGNEIAQPGAEPHGLGTASWQSRSKEQCASENDDRDRSVTPMRTERPVAAH